MATILAPVIGSSRNGPDKPCRDALRLDAILPARVLGPVLRLALARLAAICYRHGLGAAGRICGLGDQDTSGRFFRNWGCRIIEIGYVYSAQRGVANDRCSLLVYGFSRVVLDCVKRGRGACNQSARSVDIWARRVSGQTANLTACLPLMRHALLKRGTAGPASARWSQSSAHRPLAISQRRSCAKPFRISARCFLFSRRCCHS
jgi:hypothetical protein